MPVSDLRPRTSLRHTGAAALRGGGRREREPLMPQVLSLHELPEAMRELGWLADPLKALPPMPEDSPPVPTIDEGYQVRGRPAALCNSL